MSRLHAALALAVLALSGALSAQVPDLSKMDIVERSVPNGPVAIVDGVPVDPEDFLRTYQRHLSEVALMSGVREINDEFRVRVGLNTLGELVKREILVKEGTRRGLKVPEPEVEKAYKERLDQFMEQLKAAGNANPTEGEILQLAGQTREEARESIHRQLLEMRTAQAIAKEKAGKVSDADVKTFFEKRPELFQRPGQLHLHQMLFRPKPSPQKADEAAWKAAEALGERARARVMAGETFDAVARDMSEAPDAQKGGDMGMMAAEQLPPFFLERARTMKTGDVSPVFRSEYGVHVIRLAASAEAASVGFDEAKPNIRKMLEGVRAEDAVESFIEPVVNDPERTKIFLQLERTLAILSQSGAGGSAGNAPTAAPTSAPASAPAPAKDTGKKRR
ncbi:MAG: peptidylprolyl isomerase [Candidatus Hydrogenedentes bacterium]|nr:peptidylprolyl isomerase [Candidatus Hydrogenedentota bacterium]